MRPALLLTLMATAAVQAACGEPPAATPDVPRPASESGRAHNFDVERTVSGLDRPTFVGAAPGDPDALWVLEQPGRVLRFAGEGPPTVLLDMRDEVGVGAEQGLLGIAFHPRYASNRRLYLNWTDPRGDTRIAEFRAGPDHTVAARPLRRLLALRQPEENHNGGHLAFGPDGRLYAGLGDGGGAFDPRRTAQDPGTLLGKLIAADVEAGEPDWEIVLMGLRNPWRFWFDMGMGEVWIGDVGQDAVEEIDRVALEPDEPPKNLGWSAYEGTRRISGDRPVDPAGELVFPVAAYGHDEDGGCSVTGGLVYGGSALPSLSRRYVYGDFCAGALWSLRPRPGGPVDDVRRERAAVPQLTHIGVDGSGELVFASASGSLYRAVAPAG